MILSPDVDVFTKTGNLLKTPRKTKKTTTYTNPKILNTEI